MHRITGRALLVLITALALPRLAAGEPGGLEHGTGTATQPAVYRIMTGVPSTAGAWFLMLHGSYGIRPSALADGDRRQQFGARLGAGYAPWSFLQIGLTGETSVSTYQGADPSTESSVTGTVGDPRVTLRTGWSLGHGVSLGALAEVWFPAPRGPFRISNVGRSITPTVLVALSVTPERIPIGVHFNVGYRHDRSSLAVANRSALDTEQLLLADVTSVMHIMPLSAALEYRIGPVAPFLECVAELLLSGDGLTHTPVLLTVGLRAWLGPGDAVQLMLATELGVTPTPPAPTESELWPSPPLARVIIGATFRLPVVEQRTEPRADVPPCESRDEESTEEDLPGRIAGTILCGGEPCGHGARVAVLGTETSPIAPGADDGRFSTLDVPPGTYLVRASSFGRQPVLRQVEVTSGETTNVRFDLPEAIVTERPQIRGHVTDFSGNPVQATVRIPGLDLELEVAADGTFEADAEPGRYEIIIASPGYVTQHTQVEVGDSGVVLMNFELRQR